MRANRTRETLKETSARTWDIASGEACPCRHGHRRGSTGTSVRPAGFIRNEAQPRPSTTPRRNGRFLLLIRSCFFSHISAGSVMQRIFCNDSDAAMKLSMQRYKITSCRQQFMAITPRRFGYCYRINVQNHACTARRPLFPCSWRRSRSPSLGHRQRSSPRGAARAVCCYSK